MAVSAHRDTTNGAVYIFPRTATGWVQQQKITSPLAGGYFCGWSVALSGDVLFISAPLANNDHGTVLVYGQLGGAAGPYQYATARNPDADTVYFGSSVALNGSTLAVGARAIERDP